MRIGVCLKTSDEDTLHYFSCKHIMTDYCKLSANMAKLDTAVESGEQISKDIYCLRAIILCENESLSGLHIHNKRFFTLINMKQYFRAKCNRNM